jgi:hypothetical protein
MARLPRLPFLTVAGALAATGVAIAALAQTGLRPLLPRTNIPATAVKLL